MKQVYVEEKAWQQLLEHFQQEAGKGLEAMGLLLGEVFRHEGTEWVFVREYVTAGNDASAVSVKFTEEAFKDLIPIISSKIKKSLLVGWCHSHPGFGCFLSSTDQATQRNYFNESFSVALVVDPVKGEKKFFKLYDRGYAPVSFAVVRKK